MRLTALGAGLLVVFAVLSGSSGAYADGRQCDNPTPDSDAYVATAYEVAEWGFLRGKYKPLRRVATATLVGTVEAGAPICPKGAMGPCALTVLASDDIDLKTGRGPVDGDFFVLVQIENDTSLDGAELITLEGKLVNAVINLAPALLDQVPVAYLCGEWEAKRANGSRLRGKVTGMFQLPFVFPPSIPEPSYVVDPALFPNPGCCELIQKPAELSLDTYTVRVKLYFSTRGK
jgi:hypothetical protein